MKAGMILNSLRMTPSSRTRLSVLACAVFSLILALLLATPTLAFADVRKADRVGNGTVEEQDLSVGDCPSITANYAVLATKDGRIYFSRDADDEAEIASITKVMTAIVAIDNADLSTEVTVSKAAAEIGESSANLQEGDKMDLEAALKALLVPSGNDAAVAIAEAVGAVMIQKDPSLGSDPVAAFVAGMNKKSSELGLEDTLYENPHGLDDGEFMGDLHSTAFDQAKVAQCAMSYDKIREIVAGGNTTITVKRDGKSTSVELETTDELLENYKYTIGIKTGMTNLAGPSFMGAANQDGQELYAIILDSSDSYMRFDDAKTLFVWGYEHIVDVPLANTSEYTNMRVDGTSNQVPVIAEASHYEWIDRTVKVTMADPDAKVNVFDLDGNVTQSVELNEIHGTVNPGDKVGTITFKQHNQVIAQQDLVACERVEAPNPIDTMAIWWQRITQGLDDTTGRAQSKVYNVMPIINSNTAAAAA